MKSKLLLLLSACGFIFMACSTPGTDNPATPNVPATENMSAPQGDDLMGGNTGAIYDRAIEARIKEQLVQMTKILGLDARQQAAIAEILRAQYKSALELQRKYAKDPRGLKKAMADLQARTNKQIMALLTKEQLVKWNRWKGLTSNTGTRNG